MAKKSYDLDPVEETVVAPKVVEPVKLEPVSQTLLYYPAKSDGAQYHADQAAKHLRELGLDAFVQPVLVPGSLEGMNSLVLVTK